MFGDGIKLFGVRKGTCGEDLIWVLKDNMLTISPSYDSPFPNVMEDFTLDEEKKTSSAPWFRYNRAIRGIVIQGKVSRIGASAFAYLDYIIGIRLPDSVISIGDHAFHGCSALNYLQLPNSVLQIGGHAFYGCSNLRDIKLPDRIESIGESVFECCSGLHAVSIPNSVTRIGKRVFSRCKDLVTINIPNSVTGIGEYAFAESGLIAINIPGSVRYIAAHAFSGCSELTRINIPDSVSEIGEFAFAGCSKLTQINIPDSVSEIGDCAFSGCSGLADSDGFVIIRNVLYGYYGTENELWIPDGVISIEVAGGFRNLSAIHIPVSVRKIAEGVFRNCGERVYRDQSGHIFKEYRKLEKVFYSGTDAQWWKIQIGNYNDSLIKAEFHYEKAAVLVPAAEPVNASAGCAVQPESQAEQTSEPQPEPRPELQPKPYSGSKPYIFFSYCHKDMEPALKLIRLLQNDGYRVWYDEDIRPSAEFPKYISDHLDGCSCAVSMISEAYLNSEFCKKEIFYAEKNKIPQVLVYSEDVALPGDWDLMMGLIQAIPNNIYQDDSGFLHKFRQTSDIEQCRKD